MKESFVNRIGAVVADNQSAEVAEPREGALDFPAATVTAQCATILRARLAPVPAMWCDQFDASRRRLRAQRIAIVSAIGNDSPHVLARPAGAVLSAYTDR